MTPIPNTETDAPGQHRSFDTFRRAVLRGLGVLLPPLLTIVIFLWVGSTVVRYLLTPMEDAARYVLVEYGSDIKPRTAFPESRVVNGQVSTPDGEYIRTGDKRFIPAGVFLEVQESVGPGLMPKSATDVYQLYMEDRWLRREVVIPIFTCGFILVLYLLGKFLAAGVGRFFWSQFERIIDRLPIVRNVYSSVKQVTDFVFTDPDLEYTRVVAIEYPRRGIWTVAFVTGESMLDIESAANESVMSVLVPTSPMPFTGFTVTVKKSETLDLNITLDQAFQFIVSCGVVVPPQQITAAVRRAKGEAPPVNGAPLTANKLESAEHIAAARPESDDD
ncbi:hypothetical protein Pla175_37270 [Pirellulimonas nuda]|uniref:DUF502 domain-containing protein n=1 Tax=Pirellulimonas nuda TaxID=2528009 RepID=A0A518DFT2_9BACT|nr:DUF502 domain-containing protein [Pirellulimonas nuda]QDU90324.1 hypothetical protein Pla175_37270 [Pirellulimonas nuda]